MKKKPKLFYITLTIIIIACGVYLVFNHTAKWDFSWAKHKTF